MDIEFMGVTIRNSGYVRNNVFSGVVEDPSLPDAQAANYLSTDLFGRRCCTNVTRTMLINKTTYDGYDRIRVERGGTISPNLCPAYPQYEHVGGSNTGVNVYGSGSDCFVDVLVTLNTSFVLTKIYQVRLAKLVQDCDDGEPGVTTFENRCTGSTTGVGACVDNYSFGVLWRYGALRVPITSSIAGRYELKWLPESPFGCPPTTFPYAAHIDPSVLPSHAWVPPFSIPACYLSNSPSPGYTFQGGVAAVIDDLSAERMYVNITAC